MIMFTAAAIAAFLFIVAVTTLGCISDSWTFGLFAVAGLISGLGVGLWARRAV